MDTQQQAPQPRNKPQTSSTMTSTSVLKQILAKSSALAIVIVIGFLGITLAIAGGIIYKKFNQFTQAAAVKPDSIIDTIRTGWISTPTTNNNHKTVLLLGVDSLSTRGDVPPLTDTMMLVSMDLSSGEITTLPLPRDLWSDAYQTKINALYYYGIERDPSHPENFPATVIADLTQIPIHHTVVISMEQVAQLIDIIGGIEVDVPVTFTDSQFPRPDVDITVQSDPDVLYQTVQFNQGVMTMDSTTALQYIRSRHGNNEQNTDQARSHRQQLVIQAILHKLTTKEYLTNPTLMGHLYRFYLDNFSSYFSPVEAIATAKTVLPVRNQIRLEQRAFTIGDSEKSTIYHPSPQGYSGQWVYAIGDTEAFQQEVQSKLY